MKAEKKKLYEVVSVEKELPELNKKVAVIGEGKASNPQMGGAYLFVTHRQEVSEKYSRIVDDNGFMYSRYVNSWLKELPEGYYFTPDELEEFLKETLRKGVNIGLKNVEPPRFENDCNFNPTKAVKECERYLSSLNIK